MNVTTKESKTVLRCAKVMMIQTLLGTFPYNLMHTLTWKNLHQLAQLFILLGIMQ